jgi:hypothetical protein
MPSSAHSGPASPGGKRPALMRGPRPPFTHRAGEELRSAFPRRRWPFRRRRVFHHALRVTPHLGTSFPLTLLRSYLVVIHGGRRRAAHVDGSEIGHRKTNKRLYVSPYLTTSRTSSRLVQPKHRHGLATMHGGTVAIPTSNAVAFHAIGSISPISVFRSARSTTTTHGTRLQSNDEQISAANLKLDSALAMAGAPSAVTRSGEFGMVATKTVAPTASTQPK